MKNTAQTIREVIARVAMVPVREVVDSASISSLGISSFDRIECVLAIEEALQIELPQETLEQARTVADFLQAVERVMTERIVAESA